MNHRLDKRIGRQAQKDPTHNLIEKNDWPNCQ